MSAKLRDRVCDKITGFGGIVFGEASYMTGYRQILVIPECLDKDGNYPKSLWFDEDRLTVVQENAIADFHVTSPGGPQDNEPPMK